VTAPSALDKQFVEIRDALQQYGRSRFPALHNDVDDLVAQSLSDLWEFLGRQADAGLNRRSPRPESTPDPTILRKVAFTIFKRRAVDALRGPAKRWAIESLEAIEEMPADSEGTQFERAILLQKMLQVCIAELAEASVQDRALFALATGFGRQQDGAMDARSRQRLHRLRERLAAAIRRDLGEDAAALLHQDI